MIELPSTTPRSALWAALAWRQMLRDFRAGELRLLVVAVMLAVAALSAVGFFADRIEGGLARDARQLLGGDAIVSSDRPAPAGFERDHRRAVGDENRGQGRALHGRITAPGPVAIVRGACMLRSTKFFVK